MLAPEDQKRLDAILGDYTEELREALIQEGYAALIHPDYFRQHPEKLPEPQQARRKTEVKVKGNGGSGIEESWVRRNGRLIHIKPYPEHNRIIVHDYGEWA